MGFESFIAWKHLTHRRKTGFISLISLISVTGVTLGVMALIVVLAVMSGFDRELKSKIVNVNSHLRIDKIGGIDTPDKDIQTILDHQIPNLKTVAPFIEGQAILRSERNAIGVVVKGVDTEREDLSIFKSHMIFGTFDLRDSLHVETKRRWLLFTKEVETSYGGIVIGDGLAAILRVKIGDGVNLISPFQEDASPLGKAESRVFTVKGIFSVGMNEFDTSLALVSISQAQEIYHLGNRVTGLGMRFEDIDDVQNWKAILSSSFSSGYIIRSWYDMNKNFFQALKVEKTVMTILLALIILVAAFNIISTLIMVVMEKTRDIGLLRAIGARRSSIRRIFILEGFGVGISGIIFGTILGLAMAFNLNNSGSPDSAMPLK